MNSPPPKQVTTLHWEEMMQPTDDMGLYHGAATAPCTFSRKMVTSPWPTGIRAGAEYMMPTMR